MRKLASIQKIKSITPIKNCDNIVMATILGWEIIIRKEDFEENDLCLFFEIDSILPDLPCFEFLRYRKHRIKSLKMHKVISQGLAMPIKTINEILPSFDISSLKIDSDLTEILGIKKHSTDEEDENENQDNNVKKSWFQKKFSYLKWKLFGYKPIKTGSFPNYVPKTDETRIQNCGNKLEKYEGQLSYITEKLEGCSGTFVYKKEGNWLSKLFGKGYTFLACSRNCIIFNSRNDKTTTHHIYQAGLKYDIEKMMAKLDRNIAVQFECIGKSNNTGGKAIQGNIYNLEEFDLRVFLIWDIDNKKYFSFNEMLVLLEELKLPMVPLISVNVPIINDIKYYLKLANGKSELNNKVLREGIVIRLMSDDWSFKSINNEYLLKQEMINK